jgi:hypothetical protein
MKLKALSVLAGVAGTLIVCDPAAAEYQGITWSYVPNYFGLWSVDVHAEFNDPGDRLLAVAGTAAAPLSLDVLGGTFYQHPTFDGETAPNPDLFGLFPSLAFDTFVTIGMREDDGSDATQLTPYWPSVGEAGLAAEANLAWFVTPNDAQGMPDKYGRVPIGRFSTANGIAPRGLFAILALSGGEPILIYTGFCGRFETVPCTEGDVNSDNVVGVGDFLSMLGDWGPCPPKPEFCFADLNDDGVVDIVDFLLLQANWTPRAEPLALVDADVNGDGVVDGLDLMALRLCWMYFGQGCETSDLDGDGAIGVRDLLIMLAGWG